MKLRDLFEAQKRLDLSTRGTKEERNEHERDMLASMRRLGTGCPFCLHIAPDREALAFHVGDCSGRLGWLRAHTEREQMERALDTEPEAAQPEANPSTDDSEKERLVGQVVELREAGDALLERLKALHFPSGWDGVPEGLKKDCVTCKAIAAWVVLSAAGTEAEQEKANAGVASAAATAPGEKQ